jgi:hypothetical protein
LKKLTIGDDGFMLPTEAVTQTFAILAKRGVGVRPTDQLFFLYQDDGPGKTLDYKLVARAAPAGTMSSSRLVAAV